MDKGCLPKYLITSHSINLHSKSHPSNHSPISPTQAQSQWIVVGLTLLLNALAVGCSFGAPATFHVQTYLNTSTGVLGGSPQHGESSPVGQLASGGGAVFYGVVRATGKNDSGGGNGGVYKLVTTNGEN